MLNHRVHARLPFLLGLTGWLDNLCAFGAQRFDGVDCEVALAFYTMRLVKLML
jgi:hypothetical protein